MKKTNFNCFLPSFEDRSGHENSYLEAFEKFSNKSKFNVILFVPKNNKIKTKLSKQNIFSKNRKFFLKKIYNIYQNIKEINKVYKLSKKQSILFLDGYSFYFLLSLILSNSNSYKYKKLILYCRYNYEYIQKIIFKIFINFLNKKFKKCIFITDNDLNYNIIKNRFKKNTVRLFPTPFFSSKKILINTRKFEKKILCPGQYRKEKFGKNLINFLKKNENKRIEISISENFKNAISQKIKLIKFKENLNKKKYLQLMKRNQIIILPYDERLYKYRTSGIFFESINYGKLIFVTHDTSFANELKKFKLNELVINDWSNFDIDEKLNKLKLNNIYQKLKLMKNKYLKFHNKNNFVNRLKKICE